MGNSHFPIDDQFYLATDKDVGIVGLWMPKGQKPEAITFPSEILTFHALGRRINGTLDTVFEAELPCFISHIKCGDLRPPWKTSEAPPGVIHAEKDIIAVGLDGAIFQLTLLDKNALTMLNSLQTSFFKRSAQSRRSLVPRMSDTVYDTEARHID